MSRNGGLFLSPDDDDDDGYDEVDGDEDDGGHHQYSFVPTVMTMAMAIMTDGRL